MHKTPKSS